MSHTYTTQKIAEELGGRLIGDGGIVISRLAHPADIRSAHDLALAMDAELLPLLAGTPMRAVVVSGKAEIKPGFAEACIVVDHPRMAMAKLTNLFAEPVAVPEGIHPSAVVEEGATLGANVAIGAFAYVAKGVVIGANTVLHPQSYVGPNAVIGRDSVIDSGARIGSRVTLGDRCIVHMNAAIGADGFSFVTPSVEAAKAEGAITSTNAQLVRIASLGTVVIGDDVEIGACTSIDRGTIAATRIGRGTKIDNQVQIGHNVVIGENCLICGRAGIAGSAVLGNRVVMGGGSGIADHVTVGDDVIVMAMSGVGGNVPPKTIMGGVPAQPRDRTAENFLNVAKLKHFFKKIEDLAGRMDRLEKGLRGLD